MLFLLMGLGSYSSANWDMGHMAEAAGRAGLEDGKAANSQVIRVNIRK